jgi:hypothetical protein
VITWPDVINAKHLRDLGPPEDVDYIERERHAVAIHEACHAVIAYRTRQHAEIDIATIEKGSGYLGMVSSIDPEDQFTQWRSEFESDILVGLASLAGERMFFDEDNSSGVAGDLETATLIATQMEGLFGMGTTVSSLSAGQRMQTGTPGSRGKGSQEDSSAVARRMLADRIEDNLTRLLERAVEALRENERWVLSIAHALETHKTVSGEDVTAIFAGTTGPLLDGSVYHEDAFIDRLREYHQAAKQAHHTHSKPGVSLPTPEPAYAITIPDGYLNGNGNLLTATGTGTAGAEDVIDFGGYGDPSGNGSANGDGAYGQWRAPTYKPPGSDDEQREPGDEP